LRIYVFIAGIICISMELDLSMSFCPSWWCTCTIDDLLIYCKEKWIVRGLFYIFLGTIGFEENISETSSSGPLLGIHTDHHWGPVWLLPDNHDDSRIIHHHPNAWNMALQACENIVQMGMQNILSLFLWVSSTLLVLCGSLYVLGGVLCLKRWKERLVSKYDYVP